MYISCKFKCQLSLNWHLNLTKVCATQSWSLIIHCGISLGSLPKWLNSIFVLSYDLLSFKDGENKINQGSKLKVLAIIAVILLLYTTLNPW